MMKRVGKIAICLAAGLVLNTGLSADNVAPPNNPYAPIVARNIFDLNPPQAVASTAPEPPSKVTPNGIMTIFGTPQVLFNVDVPPRPPAPATQKSYILSEGQQEDDIEVVHIDEKNGVVTFNNHGVVQEIPLVKAPPITTPTRVVMNSGYTPPAGAPGGFRGPGGPGGGNFMRFGGGSGQNRNMGNSGGNFGNNPGGNFGSTGGASTQPQLSPEEQTILIAAQKAQAKQSGDPIWKIYPPTDLDEAAGTVNTSPSGGPPQP
jgi:hypothetical protein